tara:strand:+ start:533 stop:1267 length:735 start_codon:yes stop_codon:yes gene_type:complete
MSVGFILGVAAGAVQAAAVIPTRTPVSFTNNGATFSPSVKQFGTHSAVFDSGGSDTITAPNNSAFYLGTGPYTIEFWFNTADTVGEIFNQQDIGDNVGWGIGPRSSQRMLYVAGDNTSISVLVPSTGGYSDNTWSHFAVCKGSGAGIALFTNGTRVYHNASWNVDAADSTATLRFGTGSGVSSGVFSGNYPYEGYLDEVRVSTVDRYGVGNSTHTVPTASFDNDADTILLMHFDNDVVDDGGPQ